jgi:hypothetical protein
MIFTCVAPHTKNNGLPIGGPLLSKNLCFLHTYHRIQKARDSRLTVPYSVKTCAFYTRSTAYKKQGAPDRQSLTQQKFILFTCVAPCTKSKGLLIVGPLLNKKLILFTRVAPHIKTRGSRSTVRLYHLNNKPSDLNRQFNILLIYGCY